MAVPSGTNESTARTLARRPPKRVLGEIGDQGVGDPAAGRAALIDDQHPAARGGV